MRVNEVARATGVSVRSLHHYEDVGLLSPERSVNGYRVFTRADVRRVEVIRRLQGVGFSLSEIREFAPCWRDERALDAQPVAEMRQLYRTKLAELDRQISQLQVVRDELAGRLARLDGQEAPCNSD